METFYKILSWTFGVLSTIILIGVGVKLIINLPNIESLPKELFFNKTQLEFSLETVKTLLPMCSGYILFAAPIIKYLKTENLIWNKSIMTGTILTFGFGVIAVGLWSGVFAYLGNASGGIDFETNNYSFYNYNWNRAVRFSSFAHLSFFTSISWFITTVLLTLIEEKLKNPKR